LINLSSCILHYVSYTCLYVRVHLCQLLAKFLHRHKKMVGVTGLEPVTTGPPCRCATNCATPRYPGFNLGGVYVNSEYCSIFYFIDFNSLKISRNNSFTFVLTRL